MNRTERKKLETFNTIIKKSSEIFKKNGYEKSTMEEIAREADISKATLYKYFSDKDTILIAYIQEILKEKREKIEENIRDIKGIANKLHYLFEAISNVFLEDKILAANYFKIRINETLRFSEDNNRKGNMRQIISIILGDAQDAGEIRKDIPIDYIIRSFQTLTRQYLVVYFTSESEEEKALERKYLVELFLNGVETKGRES